MKQQQDKQKRPNKKLREHIRKRDSKSSPSARILVTKSKSKKVRTYTVVQKMALGYQLESDEAQILGKVQ